MENALVSAEVPLKYLGLALILGTAGLAAPVPYSIEFQMFRTMSPDFDVEPSGGSFLFDAANQTAPFSSFIVTWRGANFDLTAAANTWSSPGFGCDLQTAAPARGVNIVFQSFGPPCANIDYHWSGNYSPGVGVEIFVFLAGNLDCCGGITIDAVHPIDDPGGVFQSGHGRWTVAEVPEPWTLFPLAIGASLCGLAKRKVRADR